MSLSKHPSLLAVAPALLLAPLVNDTLALTTSETAAFPAGAVAVEFQLTAT